MPPKEPRTIRLDPEDIQFIEESNFEFATETRDWLTTQRINYAAGICGHCDRIIYIGAHMVVSGGTPLGNALGLDQGQDIDICPDCEDEVMSVINSDDTAFTLGLHDAYETYAEYRGERDAVIEAYADPGGEDRSEWAALITDRQHLDADTRHELVGKWLTAINPRAYYGDNVVPDAILTVYGIDSS